MHWMRGLLWRCHALEHVLLHAGMSIGQNLLIMLRIGLEQKA